MMKIIGNSTVDLLQRLDRKGLHNGFRRITVPETPDKDIESYASLPRW
jgi:hypothetical protein